MLSLGYEDSPFNSLFGELEGGLFNETGVKETPYPQNDGSCGSDLLQELDELAESPLADWLTEKVDFGLLEFQDDGNLIMPDSEFNTQLSEMPSLLVNSEVDELQELAVSPADLELLNSLVVNSEFPPQPVSPGENTAPHLLALSPMSSPPPSRSHSPMSFLSIPENTDISSLTPAATLLSVLVQQSQEQLYLTSPSISSEASALSPLNSPSPSLASYAPSEVEEEVISDSPKRSRSKLKTASGTKYGKFTDKKSRKRDQNKAAATRYREKKKAEADVQLSEEELLLAKNKALKEQVDSLAREIQYMKELMVDVYKAKGMI